ncbi:MAG: thiamine-monophosphate kinase, partial [Pseudomonadota bacterium]|nr:thiamine-monophosphate kinase [Pseudomonadota bacterium]
QLGWKTLAVNLSDLAAMGATPRWVLLAGALPDADEAWISAFADGFFRCAKRYGAEVIGGDTTRGPRNLCVTAIGELPAGSALRRDGARLDDDIWVSGQPGLAALGLAHLQGKTTLPEALARRCVMALQRPLPRIELGLRLRGIATSAIDVSDGLLADLGHILERSGLAADLFEGQFPLIPPGSVPRLAREAQLGGGDDYELCFTTPIAARQQVVMLAAELDLPLWRIGYTVSAATESGRPIADIRLIDADGQPLPIPKKGFDHFD